MLKSLESRLEGRSEMQQGCQNNVRQVVWARQTMLFVSRCASHRTTQTPNRNWTCCTLAAKAYNKNELRVRLQNLEVADAKRCRNTVQAGSDFVRCEVGRRSPCYCCRRLAYIHVRENQKKSLSTGCLSCETQLESVGACQYHREMQWLCELG